MNPYSTIGSFFVLGLLGGFGHCVGMCNPFVLYIASRFGRGQQLPWYKCLRPHLLYNLGRITTYTSLGLICGILGKISADLTQIQGIASLVAGIFLILYGCGALLSTAINRLIENSALINFILQGIKKVRPNSPLITGMALGLLPCGLVYSALAGALATGNPISGGLAMASFGGGTTIAMTITALCSDFLMKSRGILRQISMLFLVAMGVYFVSGYYKFVTV